MFIACSLRCVENIGLRGPFWAKISKDLGLLPSCQTISTGFASGFTFRCDLHLEVGWTSTSDALFPGHFVPQNIIKVFSHVLKCFPLVSHHSYFTCLLEVCLNVFQSAFPLAAELHKPPGLLSLFYSYPIAFSNRTDFQWLSMISICTLMISYRPIENVVNKELIQTLINIQYSQVASLILTV